MQKQLDHHELNFEKKKYPLFLILDNVSDPRNVGAFFRMADAMGVSTLFLYGNTPKPPHRLLSKISRQTDRVVNYVYVSGFQEIVTALRDIQDLEWIALEITSESESLNYSTFKRPTALVVGAEETGVSNLLLQHVSRAVHISMRGQNSSMNVVIAAAMAVQEITRQFELIDITK